MAVKVPCHKVILVGEYGVGKSSLFRRFTEETFSEKLSTIGMDHYCKELTVNGDKIQIELWDTGGLEKFATLSANYFSNAAVAILCYAINDKRSFVLLSQHILETVTRSPSARIFLCGNKSDHCDASVTQNDIEMFRLECHTMITDSFNISCKTGVGCEKLFQTIATVLNNERIQRFDPSSICITPRTLQEPVRKKTCC